MEKLLMELEKSMNERKSFASLNNNNMNNMNIINGGFGYQNPNNYSLRSCSSSNISQLLLLNANAMANFRGSLNLSPPLYPSSTLALLPPHAQRHQPPLLPLPIKYATLPTTNNKLIRSSTSSRPRNQKRKKKQQQEAKASSSTPNVPKKEVIEMEALKSIVKNPAEEEETEEEILIGSGSLSVYSLSPPPSSVPMPKMLLTRPRPRQCNAEAMDAGAADHLRKLLRL